MQITQILNEARRNPNHPAQKKVYGSDVFAKYKGMSAEEIDNLYVSFTSVDKIGINPQSTYNTPIGIYTYPLKYVMDMNRPSDVPWAGDSPNMWIIRPTKPVLRLETYNNLDVDADKISKFLSKNLSDQKEVVALVNEAISSVRKSENMDASRMWNLCRMVGRTFGKLSNTVRKDSKSRELSNDVVYFNYAIRKILGYHVVRDDGLGIIHSSEPIQTLFLSKDAFEVVEKLRNNVNSYDPKGVHPFKSIKNPQSSDDVITVPDTSDTVSYLILDKNDSQFVSYMALKQFSSPPKMKDMGYMYTLPDYIGDFYGVSTYDWSKPYNREQNFKTLAKWIAANPDIKERLVTRLNMRLASQNSMDKRLREFMHDFFPEQDKFIKW